MVKEHKKSLNLKDIKKELTSLAMGDYKCGPFEVDSRIRALNNLATILLKEKQVGLSKKQALKPVEVKIVNPQDSGQAKRIEELENDILNSAKVDGDV